MKRALIFLFPALLMLSCEETLFIPEPSNDPESLFEYFWSSFNENYGGFEERNVNWDDIYSTYRPMVGANTSQEELLSIFKQMLRWLDDGHVTMITPLEDKVYISNLIRDQKIDDELFDLDLVKENYLAGAYTVNGDKGNTFGKIGNIGYLHLDFVHANLYEFSDILDGFGGMDGLVIDLRHNDGGDFTYAFSEMGRLAESTTYVYRSKTKNGPGKDDYTDWYRWDIKPQGTYFDKPIVMITDRYTISAGERLAMLLKALPNVTHIGEATNGAAATMIGQELPNGWFYTMAIQKLEFMDGNNYEGPGIPPTIEVKNSLAEMNIGIDKTLETALDLLR